MTRWTDGGWQTPTPALGENETDPVICPTGAHALAVFQATPAQATVDQNFQWPYVASTAELGCLLAGSMMDPITGKPSGPIALASWSRRTRKPIATSRRCRWRAPMSAPWPTR